MGFATEFEPDVSVMGLSSHISDKKLQSCYDRGGLRPGAGIGGPSWKSVYVGTGKFGK